MQANDREQRVIEQFIAIMDTEALIRAANDEWGSPSGVILCALKGWMDYRSDAALGLWSKPSPIQLITPFGWTIVDGLWKLRDEIVEMGAVLRADLEKMCQAQETLGYDPVQDTVERFLRERLRAENRIDSYSYPIKIRLGILAHAGKIGPRRPVADGLARECVLGMDNMLADLLCDLGDSLEIDPIDSQAVTLGLI